MILDVNAVRAAILKYMSVLGAPARVHLAPSDLAALEPADRQMLTAGAAITLVGDGDVQPGGYSIGKG